MERFNIYEGTQVQREDESLKYKITVTPWAINPQSANVSVWDITNPNTEIDVTDTTVIGSAVIAGDVITLPNIFNLTKKHTYRVDVIFVADGNTFAVPIIIKAIR